MSESRATSLAGCHDLLEEELVLLSRAVLANDHAPLYAAAISDLRAILSKARQLMDDRATGEFRALPRDRRETPVDTEPMPSAVSPAHAVEERRRRPSKRDRER